LPNGACPMAWLIAVHSKAVISVFFIVRYVAFGSSNSLVELTMLLFIMVRCSLLKHLNLSLLDEVQKYSTYLATP